VKNHLIPIDLLGPLITSKTRLKLLLRFFLNHNLSGYLQGLSKELDENTNSIRVELNRLEQAGILSSELEGRRKLYRVNEQHPLTENLTNIVRKVTGVDALVDRVVGRLPSLEQVWVCGDLAQGINSDELEVLLIGQNLDEDYIKELMSKVEKHIDKTIKYLISTNEEITQTAIGLQVWVSKKS
jgi:DNA-binding transcriptional ArsR family regulator